MARILPLLAASPFCCVAIALLMLAGCTPVPGPSAAPPLEPGVFAPTREGPENAPEGSCWGRTFSPAVVERVSTRIEVEPAKVNPDGTIATAPVYRTEDRQVIVTPRKSNWFETPCQTVLTVEFVSSLQRALLARGVYEGPVNGAMDAQTLAAVQRFQREEGLDSPVLSIQSARTLGLIAVDLPQDD
ncbi:MAG: peptidoglycan-binding domain-containing protein [Pseudomonadota bacterium]